MIAPSPNSATRRAPALSLLRRQEGFFLCATAMAEHVILSAEDIRRALSRIAHEIVEHNPTLADVVIVGMRTRGVPIAARLAQRIAEFEGQPRPVSPRRPCYAHRDKRAVRC